MKKFGCLFCCLCLLLTLIACNSTQTTASYSDASAASSSALQLETVLPPESSVCGLKFTSLEQLKSSYAEQFDVLTKQVAEKKRTPESELELIYTLISTATSQPLYWPTYDGKPIKISSPLEVSSQIPEYNKQFYQPFLYVSAFTPVTIRITATAPTSEGHVFNVEYYNPYYDYLYEQLIAELEFAAKYENEFGTYYNESGQKISRIESGLFFENEKIVLTIYTQAGCGCLDEDKFGLMKIADPVNATQK